VDFNIRLKKSFYGEGLTLLNADIIEFVLFKLKVKTRINLNREILNADPTVAYLILPIQQETIRRYMRTSSVLF
jgi:hypothetical protein